MHLIWQDTAHLPPDTISRTAQVLCRPSSPSSNRGFVETFGHPCIYLPFYHKQNKLIHMGGRIGMGGSGRRDREFREKNSSHYKLVLLHKSQLTSKLAINVHQRNQCCSTAFTRLILNEQIYIPKATTTIKIAINKCNACKLARNAFNPN